MEVDDDMVVTAVSEKGQAWGARIQVGGRLHIVSAHNMHTSKQTSVLYMSRHSIQ